MNQGFEVMDIASSGLTAERVRVSVISRNIANAHVTRTTSGGPYRRQRVTFETVLHSVSGAPEGGVRVQDVTADSGPLRAVRDPSHPDQVDGYVYYPNVDLPLEMVDLLDASRSYDANLAVLRTYRQMMEQTLDLTR
jgi:flagellar basal-body rod protein FlgC